MIRCPACGRRIPNEAPVCPTHGAPPPAPPPPADADPPVPFVVPVPAIAGFEVRKTLGQGGFGAVFLARRTSDGEEVAIKVARADNASASDALCREADALAAVGVPNVPAVFARGTLPDGAAYVVMEFVRAPILADSLAREKGPMPLDAFAAEALAILTVIEIAHGRGLVHCDLKPENVFIDPSFGAKLFDFGLVRNVSAGAKRTESTKEEAPAGTPEYMSPEQCEGRTDIDARSDVYALGVIFYEMWAGAPPFWGNPAEVQQSHRSRRPRALSRRRPLAVALEDAIMRCLAKDPARRFPDTKELRRAVSAGIAAERARLEAATPGGGVGTGGGAGAGTAAGSTFGAASPGAAPGAGPGKPAGGKPAAPARERRAVGLLFFETKSNVAAVREAGVSAGAQLAHTAGAQYVLAFGHEVGDNPTRAAATAAEMIIARGLTKQALVDLASVSVQPRPDGTRRYQSPLFAKKEQYPGEADPSGVLLSPAAVEVLPDSPAEPVPHRPGFMLLKRAAVTTERTTTRMGVAPLVGRDEIVRQLIEAARGATASAGPTITTVIGEPGYGKTHLAQMLVQHLEVIPRMQTVLIRAKEVLGGVGEQTTRELLQRMLGLPDAAPADLGRALLAAKLGPDAGKEVWGGVAVAMGWAPPEHPELAALAAAPGALRSAAARALGEGLRLAARNRPLAMVVEDAHFVDETALDAFEFATLKEGETPIWVCVVGRPSFGRGRTGWAGRAAVKQDLTLGPLEPAASAELARRLLLPVESVPAAVLARLAERTQGIPLLLVELVRGLKRDGIVRKLEKGNTWVLATEELERLPDLPLVQWLASRETETLPPDLLAHARLASVLGAEFSNEEVEGVLQELERAGLPTETQLDASIGLRRLVDSGILARHRGGRVGFRHGLLRDSVYQSVPAAERESIHRAAYEYYRRQDRLPDPARLPQMAFHASKSGLGAEAGRLYLDLAGRASARHAYLEAERLYSDALGNLPADDFARRITAGQGIGVMRFRMGRYNDALKDLSAALELTRKVDGKTAEVEILLDEAVVADWAMDWPRSRARAEEADALVAREPSLATPGVESRLVLARARSALRLDRYPDAIATFKRAFELAEKLGDSGYEAYTLGLSLYAYCQASVGNHAEAETAIERAIRIFEEHGDMIGLSSALVNRCMLWLITNQVEKMLADYLRIIQLSREFGFVMTECMAVKDLGEIYFILGRDDEALPQARRGVEMYRQMLGDAASRVYNAELLLARVQSHQGDVAGAAEIVRRLVVAQAEAAAAARGDALLSDMERVLLETMELGLGASDDAAFDKLVERGRALLMQPQDIVEILEWKALAALRGGRRLEGLRFMQDALTEAESKAQLAADRIRRQLADAGAPEASRAAGGA
jgi:tetratricopeptide (TPR) repeat protein